MLKNTFQGFFGGMNDDSRMTDEQWFDRINASYPNGLDGTLRLPAFPDEQLQKNTVGTFGKDALVQAFQFYTSVCDTLDTYKIQLHYGKDRICDFGCGWGRISRFFVRNVGIDNIVGLDVEQSFIDICNSTFKTGCFHKTAIFPPSHLPDVSFKLIVAYSVFSHLSEKAFNSWLVEFHRILQPGGAIAFTTRHRIFLDYCESLKKATLAYHKALASMFDNFDEVRRRYDTGEFIFSAAKGVTGGGSMDGSFYGETFIPIKYAREAALRNGFGEVVQIDPHGRVDQQTFIFLKPL
ncbi:MAG: class I SAM-dependent methyltransferase [Kiritimatiellae bacterium]|nr:class I SAM-dependent methyltransferase [Kiritimatiellia bacterium]MDD5521719.1 class I SAM-dependent methyltransferase [Kiritimatiellia bacterium]